MLDNSMIIFKVIESLFKGDNTNKKLKIRYNRYYKKTMGFEVFNNM